MGCAHILYIKMDDMTAPKSEAKSSGAPPGGRSPLTVIKWDMDPISQKYMLNEIFPKMVSVSLGISYHTDVCSTVHVYNKFGFN